MPENLEFIDSRQLPVCLYDIDVDDLGLTVYEFRAYMRIVRRAGGGQSACTESVENMAVACNMSRPMMIRAIKGLIERRMIQRISRAGNTSKYALSDKAQWLPGKPQNHHPVNHRTTPGKPQNHHLVNHRTTKIINKSTRKSTSKDPTVADAPAVKASSRQPDSFYESFAQAYQSAYGCPYQHKAADFVQLSNCRKQGGSWLTADKWQHALSNYFLSEIGTHTLADFSTRFGSFYRSVLDRFNKPVEVNSNGTIKQPVRETAGGRAARETLELIRQLTGQDGFDNGFDTENARALIPAVIECR